MKIRDIVADWIIMPQTIKPQGLIHKKGYGPNNRFGFRNVGNNRANENITADQLKQLQTEYAPFKDKALPAVKGQALRKHLKSLSDDDLKLLIQADIPHVSLKAQIVLDMHRYAQMRDPIISPLGNVEENFADGKGPGRAGDSKRAGIPKRATIAQLKRIRSSKTASARKKQLAHWQINMRQGRKRNK
jgi:hypothetical protein